MPQVTLKIRGADGQDHTVAFERMPSDADIDEVAASFKAKPKATISGSSFANPGERTVNPMADPRMTVRAESPKKTQQAVALFGGQGVSAGDIAKKQEAEAVNRVKATPKKFDPKRTKREIVANTNAAEAKRRQEDIRREAEVNRRRTDDSYVNQGLPREKQVPFSKQDAESIVGAGTNMSQGLKRLRQGAAKAVGLEAAPFLMGQPKDVAREVAKRGLAGGEQVAKYGPSLGTGIDPLLFAEGAIESARSGQTDVGSMIDIGASIAPGVLGLLAKGRGLIKGGKAVSELDDMLGGLDDVRRSAGGRDMATKVGGTFKGLDESGKPRIGIKVGQEAAEGPRVGPAIWKHKDYDLPVTLTGKIDTDNAGRKWAATKEGTWVPVDEIADVPVSQGVADVGASVRQTSPQTGGIPKAEGTAVSSPMRQGLRQRDIEEAARQMGIDPPKKTTVKWSQIADEAERAYDDIVKTLPKKKLAPNETLSPEQRLVGSMRLRQIADEVNDAERALHTARLSGDQKVIDKAQNAYDSLMGEADKVTKILFQSGSQDGRNLAFHRFIASGPFDADAHLLRAEKVSGGYLTDAQRSQIFKLSSEGQKAEKVVLSFEQKQQAMYEKALANVQKARPKGSKVSLRDLDGC